LIFLIFEEIVISNFQPHPTRKYMFKTLFGSNAHFLCINFPCNTNILEISQKMSTKSHPGRCL